jgi:hypothetical protein
MVIKNEVLQTTVINPSREEEISLVDNSVVSLVGAKTKYLISLSFISLQAYKFRQ